MQTGPCPTLADWPADVSPRVRRSRYAAGALLGYSIMLAFMLGLAAAALFGALWLGGDLPQPGPRYHIPLPAGAAMMLGLSRGVTYGRRAALAFLRSTDLVPEGVARRLLS